MSSLAIPSTPPPAAASAGNGSAPAAGDSHFDDALQQAKAKPQTHTDKGSGDDTPPAPKHAGQKSKDDSDHGSKDDNKGNNDAKPPPAPIAALPMAPATTRQTPADDGKSPPGATAPAPVIASAAAAAKSPPAPAAPALLATKTLASPAPPASSATPTDASADTAQGQNVQTTTQIPELANAAHSIVDSAKDTASRQPDPGNFTAQLSQLLGGHAAAATNPAPAPAPAPAQLTMQATPTQPQFAQEAAQHVAWMAGQGIQKAQIQLNPRTLGPIHVDITTHHDHVDVNFAVQHPQTVHALQQTLPQLHDMLAQQGLNLGQASVGQQSSGQQHAAFAQHAGGGHAGGSGNVETDPAPVWRPMRIAAPGGVDDFA
ncbi:MAG: flagellar hook-length control protein FliK [Rhodanobacteraceae bacterium]